MNTIQTGSIHNLYQSANAGFKVAQQESQQAAQEIAGGHLEPRSMVQLNQSNQIYKLNAKMIAVADQMTGTVLNLRA
jgi:flagellar hook protein FlgE